MKFFNTKFQENSSTSSRVDIGGEMDKRTNMKLLGAFSDYLKAFEKKFIFNCNEWSRIPWSRKQIAPRKYITAYGIVCFLP
jgi:hypothetical protein